MERTYRGSPRSRRRSSTSRKRSADTRSVPAPTIKRTSAAEDKLLADVLYDLRRLPWPIKNPKRDKTRGNVLMSPTDTISAFALGKVRRYDLPGYLVESVYNRKFPELHAKLRKLMALHDPQFRYNAIQLNRGVQTKRHRDRNNAGPSYCLAIGDYQGGGLSIYPTGETPYTLDNRYRWVHYDGARLEHSSAPVRSGTRYALVFYQATPVKVRRS